MDRPRLICGLRIAWTAVFGVLCVLLMVLWVRSYWWCDQFIKSISGTEYAALTSAEGKILIGESNHPTLRQVFRIGLTYRISYMSRDALTNRAHFPASIFLPPRFPLFPLPRFQRNFYVGPGSSYEVILPYWMFVPAIGVIAAVPWLPWKFSLRTLLIATTLVAAVLGLAVWASA